jgi:Protein of unknown function (DUF1214)
VAEEITTESRRAFRDLLDLLREADERYLSAEWYITAPDDISAGHRYLMHVLEQSLALQFEADPARPRFQKIVTPTRKANGDNSDCIYFEAPIRGDRAYRIRGNLAGSQYTAFTIEAGDGEGGYSTRTAGVMNDRDMHVESDGSYEVVLGGPSRDRNWLALPPDAAQIITRHYFEHSRSAAADPAFVVPLTIEPVEPIGPPEPWNDASIAAGIRRVANGVRGLTIDRAKPGANQPSWVSIVPNIFPKPEKPGDMAFAAFDAAYSMGRFSLAPDEALVITGRWPQCAFANVCIWNRFTQTLDYVNRPVSRNRANTVLEPDGSFRLVLAHHDPGVANWIDTEGRPTGSVFWRFFLPEGEIETPQATVVKFEELT